VKGRNHGGCDGGFLFACGLSSRALLAFEVGERLWSRSLTVEGIFWKAWEGVVEEDELKSGIREQAKNMVKGIRRVLRATKIGGIHAPVELDSMEVKREVVDADSREVGRMARHDNRASTESMASTVSSASMSSTISSAGFTASLASAVSLGFAASTVSVASVSAVSVASASSVNSGASMRALYPDHSDESYDSDDDGWYNDDDERVYELPVERLEGNLTLQSNAQPQQNRSWQDDTMPPDYETSESIARQNSSSPPYSNLSINPPAINPIHPPAIDLTRPNEGPYVIYRYPCSIMR
jgi:hypothetical protein